MVESIQRVPGCFWLMMAEFFSNRKQEGYPGLQLSKILASQVVHRASRAEEEARPIRTN